MSQFASAATNGERAQQEELSGPPAANRHRLPDERAGITHHFSIAGHEGSRISQQSLYTRFSVGL